MAGALTKVGRYQIVGELGRGSMGVVYRAFDPVIGRTIAVKTMLTEGFSALEFQEYKARFQREAQAAGILSHPNIVTVYDFGEENGILYLAMECLEGESLEKVVEAREILPVETIIPIYEQVCSALDHAHSKKIVHRDIKPANIMILGSGLVKVTDFGIAKTMATGMTQAGQILGTPNYMSPEQVKGRGVDGRSDIFSLGVILYELLTGEKPFGGQNVTTVIYKIVNQNPIPPRELDSAIHPGLSYITSKALAKGPEERYQSCRQLAEDLRNFKNLGVSPSPAATVMFKRPQFPVNAAEEVGEKTIRTPPPPRATMEPAAVRPSSLRVSARVKPEPSGRSPVLWFLVVLLFMGALGGGYYFYTFGNPLKLFEGHLQTTLPPAPPAPAAPKVGGLTVTTDVPGARISIDGRGEPDWTTPRTFSDLTVGPHVIALSKDGYHETQQTVMVEEGQISPVTAELTPEVAAEKPAEKPKVAPVAPTPLPPPAPKVGQLVATSNVEGAKISIDNRSQADWVTPHTFSDLPAGTHTLAFAKEGYDTEYRSVSIAGGRTTPINVELRIPSGEISVVTIPSGAEVTIDGKPVGISPVRVTVPAGRHSYTAELAGMQPSEGIINVAKGSSIKRTVDWSGGTAVPSGIVEIRTIPPGAIVAADGASLGDRTPANIRLTAGRHKLTLSLPGYTVAEQEIDVPANDSTPVKVHVTLSPQ